MHARVCMRRCTGLSKRPCDPNSTPWPKCCAQGVCKHKTTICPPECFAQKYIFSWCVASPKGAIKDWCPNARSKGHYTRPCQKCVFNQYKLKSLEFYFFLTVLFKNIYIYRCTNPIVCTHACCLAAEHDDPWALHASFWFGSLHSGGKARRQ